MALASNRFAKYIVQPEEQGGGSAPPAKKPNRFAKYAAPVEVPAAASQPSFFQRQGQRMVSMGEPEFKKWYAGHAKANGLDPNPDAPEHKYDYRRAFAAGAQPGPDGHWPSEFKAPDHPNRYVDGVDTITGRRVSPDPNAPNPITTAMRQSTAQVNSQFAAQKAEEERRRQERTIFNSASPGLAFRDTGSKGTVELNDDGGDFGKGMRILPIHAQRAAVGAAEAALNTPGDLAAVATVPYAMSFDPEMQGIMAGSEFGVGADTLLERIAGRVKSGGFDKMQQTLDNAPRFDFSAAKIPVPESEQSFTGALTEGFMQYLIARGAVGKFAPGGKLPTQLAKDVAATGLGFSGNTPRLADMLDPESMGFAADYIRWLKSQPGETGLVGRVKNMAEDAILNLIGMGIFRGAKASADAMSPQALTPTNAGGARLGPVSPPQPSVAPPVAPVAQAPVPQGPPRMAQAGTAGAGQQPAGGPQPVLNTVQTAPTVSKAQAREAKDTAVILGRILRAGGIKNNAIRGYLPGLIQRYESLGDSRIPLARFIERDLPQHFPEGVAGDAVAKLRGFGRERDASTGPKDTSRYTLQDTKKKLRSSQQDHLTEVIRSNTYRKDLIDAEDKIKADMRKNAEAGYETALANGLDRFTQNRAAPDEVAAFEQMRTLIASEPFLSRVPDHVKVRAIREGKPLEEAIAADPVRTAHWLQSALGKAERAAQGMGGKATPESLLYSELREAVLDPLQKAVPGYKGARNAHGDLFGADEALEFGEDLFLAARSEVETARKARDFGKLSKQQQTVATMSIRDKLLNEFRGTPEDAAAKLTRMQQEGVLDAIERILGADGKRITAAIRETVEENDWLRSIDQGSGSPTFANAAGARDAAENVRGPINKAVGSLGDKRTYLGAVVGDVVLSSVGVPPVLTVGKATSDVVGAAGRPSARQLSNATKGLFGLPEPKTPAPPPTRAPRGPRKPKAPEQLEADLETLLKRYDEIDHRNNPTESARVLKQIDALKKRLAKPPATTAPRRPPEQSGFGGGRKLPMDEASRMARARDMGFDVDTPLYHGTRANFDDFDVNAKANWDKNTNRTKAVFLARSPEEASAFSQGMNETGNAHVRPVYVRGRLKEIDWKQQTGMRLYDVDAMESILRSAKKNGYDGVRIKGMKDVYGDADQIAIFNPKNIRGKFAKFDPSESSSSKLLAGTGANATGLGGAGGAVAGYIGNPVDANRDGVINDDDRGLNAMGGLVTGLVGGAGANRLLGPRRGVSKAGPAVKTSAASLQNAEKILADYRVARQLSDDQLAPLADAINAEMRRLQTKTVAVGGERIPYSNTEEGYQRVMKLNGLLMNAFKTADGEIDLAKAMRFAEKNDPDRALRVEAGRAVMDIEDGVKRKKPKTGPQKPPAQSGFGGAPTNGPRRPLMSGKVISELERAKKTLPPQVRSQIAANAAKPPTLRVSAAEATGDDPSLYTLAAPFQRTRNGIIPGRKPKPNAIETGVRDTMARIDASTGKPPPLDEAGEAMRLSERQRRAAKSAAQTTANKLNPYVNEAAGIPDKPLPKSVAAREQEATELAITARKLLEKHRLTANEYEQAVAQANARKAEIADALVTGRIAPPNQKGLLPGSAGQTVPPRQMKPVSRRDAEEMAELLFNRENAEMLDAVLSGRVTPRNRDRYHAALLSAAGGTAGAAGIAAVLADIEGAAQRRRDEVAARKPKPVYEDPGDPRFVWDWDKIKSTRNKHMEDIQIKLNELPPNTSGGKFNLKPDGIWRENGPTDRAIRKWLYDNGFDPNEDFTMEHWDILTEQFQEAQQKRGSTKAAPYRGSLGEMTTP